MIPHSSYSLTHEGELEGVIVVRLKSLPRSTFALVVLFATSCHVWPVYIMMGLWYAAKFLSERHLWAQVEWWLEHRHGWLVKRQWARSWLGRVTRDEYQVLGSTSIPARLDTLVFWESFSWLTSVGTTRNTVNRLGWSRIGLAVIILNAAGAGLIGRPAVISGGYNKCHSLQLQNHYAHFPPLQHTHIHARHSYAELVVGNDHGFRGIVCWPWQEESCVIG